MAGVSSPNTTKWMSYLADTAVLDVEDPHAGSFFWCHQHTAEQQADCSVEGNAARVESADEDGAEKEATNLRKRTRDDGVKESAGNKACREKMRRDRLNDKFVELSQALDPEKPIKTDKGAILCEAARVVCQLRSEAAQLKEGNAQLRDQIKDLKGEKAELRDEKARLKSEKERLEQQVKLMTLPHGYIPHPAAIQAAAAAYAAQHTLSQHTLSQHTLSQHTLSFPLPPHATNVQCHHSKRINPSHNTHRNSNTNSNVTGGVLDMNISPGNLNSVQDRMDTNGNSNAAYDHKSNVEGSKSSPSGYPGVAMWHWMPPAALDTSQDHVRHPPVA